MHNSRFPRWQFSRISAAGLLTALCGISLLFVAKFLSPSQLSWMVVSGGLTFVFLCQTLLDQARGPRAQEPPIASQQPQQALQPAPEKQPQVTDPLAYGAPHAALISLPNLTPVADQLCQAVPDADFALAPAKAQGNADATLYAAQWRPQALDRLTLDADLRLALKRKEFLLYYQPIVVLSTEQIIGFEALLRWRHPQHGLLSAAEFLSSAEAMGLTIPIGIWVLHEACCQTRRWQRAFPRMWPLTISVNLSRKQFFAPGFLPLIRRVLEETGLAPTSLNLEITEGDWLHSPDEATARFHQLKQLGVQLHLDNFGAGDASVAGLQALPIQTIKINDTWIQRIGSQPNGAELIRSTIAAARDEGFKTIAKGVETQEQLEQLKSFGCPYAQGYLLSQPVDKTAAEQLLRVRKNTYSMHHFAMP